MGPMLALLFASCKKEVEQPIIDWEVFYRVSSISDINVTHIRYIDVDGMEKTVTNQRDFSKTIVAQTGFTCKIEAEGEMTNGGIFVRLEARPLTLLSPTVTLTRDTGQAGTVPRFFNISINHTLR
jgi:hypothetical protein